MLLESQSITFFISGQPSFTSGLSLDDLGEESPALKRAHDALMAACGLGPKPCNEAATEASAEIQAEEASESPNQPHFNQPMDHFIPSFPLPDAPLLSSTFPSLFPPQSLFPSAPYSSPIPRVPVDSPAVF